VQQGAGVEDGVELGEVGDGHGGWGKFAVVGSGLQLLAMV
jgi:hypothetical protein